MDKMTVVVDNASLTTSYGTHKKGGAIKSVGLPY